MVNTETGEALAQGVAATRREGHLKRVVPMADGTLVVVPLRAELRPKVLFRVGSATEIEALVRKGIDVAGPEQREVSARKHRLCATQRKLMSR